MYQRKHHKRSHRRSGKSAALLVSLLLLLTVTVGGTIAFLMDTDGPLHNRFNPSKVTTYKGRAIVVIRSGNKPGKATITISSSKFDKSISETILVR